MHNHTDFSTDNYTDTFVTIGEVVYITRYFYSPDNKYCYQVWQEEVKAENELRRRTHIFDFFPDAVINSLNYIRHVHRSSSHLS